MKDTAPCRSSAIGSSFCVFLISGKKGRAGTPGELSEELPSQMPPFLLFMGSFEFQRRIRDHASLFPLLEKPEGLSRQKTGRVQYYSPDRKISDTEAGKPDYIRLPEINVR